MKVPKLYVPRPYPPVKAIQWIDHGDHPNVVPINDPNSTIPEGDLVDDAGKRISGITSGDYIIQRYKKKLYVVSMDEFENTYQLDPNDKVHYRTFHAEISSSKMGIVAVATRKLENLNALQASFAFSSGPYNKVDKRELRATAVLRLGIEGNDEPFDDIEPIKLFIKGHANAYEVYPTTRGLYSFRLPEVEKLTTEEFNARVQEELKNPGTYPSKRIVSKLLRELAKQEANRLGISWRKYI